MLIGPRESKELLFHGLLNHSEANIAEIQASARQGRVVGAALWQTLPSGQQQRQGNRRLSCFLYFLSRRPEPGVVRPEARGSARNPQQNVWRAKFTPTRRMHVLLVDFSTPSKAKWVVKPVTVLSAAVGRAHGRNVLRGSSATLKSRGGPRRRTAARPSVTRARTGSRSGPSSSST